ncbi:MAG: (2Fe-2S)-binding protein [Planctomycetaceae bacterium]
MSTASIASEASLCHCLAVSEQTVRAVIAFGGCQSLCDVMQRTGAGQGCTACHHRICRLLPTDGQQVNSQPR